MVEQLQELLVKAGEQLGVAAEAVWGVLLQQTKVELAINIVILVIAFLAIVVGILGGVKMLKAYAEQYATRDRWDRDEWLEPVGWVLLIVPPLFGGLTILFLIRETAQLILNPPMWVFEYLVRMFQ